MPIILAGALLRLANLDHPSIWGDEAATFGRVCGTYRDLLNVLQNAGFAPLHYELYWLIAQRFWMTPTVLRIVPALSGILMIPAMYFLALHIVTRRAAVVAAVLTAGSAYMINYSRDAKMYSDFWLACVLSVGCYLCWLRDRSRLAWLGWIACSIAMVGLHAPGLILLALPPIFLLTHPRPHWKQAVLTLLGLVVIAAGPVGYYEKYSRLVDRANTQDFDEAAGLSWVPGYNAGRTGPSHVLYATSAFLMSWEWPKDEDLNLVSPDLRHPRMAMTIALIALAALGVFPWRRRATSLAVAPPLQTDAFAVPASSAPEDSAPAIATPATAAPGSTPPALLAQDGAVAPRAPIALSAESNPAPPWWRSALWLGFWIVLPAYGFYCKSVADFASPYDWISALGGLISGHWTLFAAEILAVAILCSIWRPAAHFLAVIVPVGAAAILFALCLAGVSADATPASLVDQFQSNGWNIFSAWFAILSSPPAIVAGLALFLPITLYFSANRWSARLGILLQLALVVAAVYFACVGLYAALPKETIGSVWIPRYIAVVWPAFAIALAALYTRLPTRAFQWLAIGLYLAINLQVASIRIFGDTEPPIDRIVADLLNSDVTRFESLDSTALAVANEDPTHRDWMIGWHSRRDDLDQRHTRVFADESGGVQGPGGADLHSQSARYYASVFGEVPTTPMFLRFGAGAHPFEPDQDPGASHVALIAAADPTLTRLIVWDRIDPDSLDGPDPLIRALGPNWRFTAKERMGCMIHWTGQQLPSFRRREYERKANSDHSLSGAVRQSNNP